MYDHVRIFVPENLNRGAGLNDAITFNRLAGEAKIPPPLFTEDAAAWKIADTQETRGTGVTHRGAKAESLPVSLRFDSVARLDIETGSQGSDWPASTKSTMDGPWQSSVPCVRGRLLPVRMQRQGPSTTSAARTVAQRKQRARFA